MDLKSSLAIAACLLSQVSVGGEPAGPSPSLHVGDPVLLELTGKPALALLRLQGSESFEAMKNEELRFCVPLEGTVVAIGEEGEVQLQYQTTPRRVTQESRLVTVAVRIDSSRVEPVPAYGPVDSPERLKGVTELAKQVRELQVRQSKLPKVRLDSMEGVRLCGWKMVEEVVD